MSAKEGTQARRANKERSPAGGGKDGEEKPRPNELGRALKTVYDDTLREEVPPDFLDLLGKLS